jgi:hypothetical protein
LKRRRSSAATLRWRRGDIVGGCLGQRGGGWAAQFDHGFVGFSSGEDGVDPSGAQASLFSTMAYVPALALRTPCSMSARVRTVNCRLLAVRLR